METIPNVELPNAAGGPDPFELAAAAADDSTDAIVLLFQRDHHCPKCRQQVQDVAERYSEFEALNTLVVSILPESTDKAAEWRDAYDLPYPLLADESKNVSKEFNQPTRFGALGSLHDMIGRMPFALVLDVRDGKPTPIFTHKGSMPADRPSIDDLLDSVQSKSTDMPAASVDDRDGLQNDQ